MIGYQCPNYGWSTGTPNKRGTSKETYFSTHDSKVFRKLKSSKFNPNNSPELKLHISASIINFPSIVRSVRSLRSRLTLDVPVDLSPRAGPIFCGMS